MLSIGTLPRALIKGYALCVFIAVISGCEWVDNSLKGTFGSPGFFAVESNTEFLTLPEGDTAHIGLSLSDKSPEDVVADWEIVGGSGEFAAHKGTFTISRNATIAQVPAIHALNDARLEGNVNYTLVVWV